MFYLGLSDNISVVKFEIRVNIDDNLEIIKELSVSEKNSL